MEKQIEKISHGALFKGAISNIGAAICVVSILLFFKFSIIFVIPLITFVIGFILFMSIQLIEIDYGKRRIRKVLNLIFYKHGEWLPLDDFDELVFGADHETLKVIMPMHPIMQKDINLWFYDIYILNKNNPKKTLLLISCSSIQEGQEKLEEYAEKLNIEMIDTIKQGWENARREGRAN